jgi:hypothetical protein
MDIFHKSILYLIPGIAEAKLHQANCESNLARYGLYSMIRFNRNLVYVSWICGTGLYLYNYKWFPTILIVVQNGLYFNFIYKYRYFV